MMPYLVQYDDAAVIDFEASVNYYNEQQTGLGERFANAVFDAVQLIEKNPKTGTIRYDGVRCLIVKSFPYLIHYLIEEQEKMVVIEAIYHTKRNSYWEP